MLDRVHGAGCPGVTFQKFLHPFKGFVGDDCLVGIGDAHPFILRHSLNLVYLVAFHPAAALHQIPGVNRISENIGYNLVVKLSRDYEQEQAQLKTVVETLGREVKQQEQKKTNVRKFISVVKKYTDMTQLDATILREFVEQIRVSDTYTTDEQQKRVKIREIEIVYNFIGAFDFEEAREQSQTAQDKNNAKVGAA